MAKSSEHRQLERLILERDLTVSRLINVPAGEGVVQCSITTLSAETKSLARKDADKRFPAPPVVNVQLPGGGSLAKFDLEDGDYRTEIKAWGKALSNATIAATLSITPEQVEELETTFSHHFIAELFGTVELVNGVQSEPLAELIREAVWAPEVLTWLETYVPDNDGDDLTITDTPLFREIDCVLDAGLTLDAWATMSARTKLLLLAHYDAKAFRAAYISWHQSQRIKKQTGGTKINRHIK